MLITVKNLGKRYSRDWIFKNLDWEFKEGTVTAILGPNGSGKSTLLQILSGHMVPSVGSISYNSGGKVIPVEDVFGSVAIAAPYLELTEEFTLRETIRFHFSFKEVKKGLPISELPEVFGLAHALDKKIKDYSSGMLQRLKLGLAFYSRCDLLFLDEPTSNLDEKSLHWYHSLLAGIEAGTCVFIASNQPHEYPEKAQKLHIQKYSGVTPQPQGG